jgi:hypothetical protein
MAALGEDGFLAGLGINLENARASDGVAGIGPDDVTRAELIRCKWSAGSVMRGNRKRGSQEKKAHGGQLRLLESGDDRRPI